MKTPPAKLPWTLQDDDVRDADGETVLGSAPYDNYIADENMPHIVHAVNAYPRLIEALKKSGHAKPLLDELGEGE